MPRWFRFVTSVAFAVSGLSGLAAQTASADTPSTLSAAQNLQQCLAKTGHLNLVTLVDTSGSLGFATGTIPPSDPQNSRVAALRALLQQVDGFASQQSSTVTNMNNVKVNVAIVGFDSTATTFANWTDLSPQTLPHLNQVAESFATKNVGAHTNFVSGLDQAWNLIAEEEQSDPNSCSAVVWFTDGQIDLGNGQPLASQVGQMCSLKGPTEVLESNHVYTFAVGLGDSGGMTPGAASELQSYVLGGPNDVTSDCGHGALTPALGGFFKVTSPQRLLFAFESILDPSIPANLPSLYGCQTIAGCQSSLAFYISRDVNGVTLTGVGPTGAELDASFTGPKLSGTVQLSPTDPQVSIGGLVLHYEPLASNSVMITATVTNASAAQGKWSVNFLDANRGKVLYSLQMQTPYALKLTSGSPLTQTVRKTGTIQLVNAVTGQPVSGVPITQVSASISPADIQTNTPTYLNLTPVGSDEWTFTFTNDFQYSLLQLKTSGNLLVDNGLLHAQVSGDSSVPAPLPADYPTISLAHQSMKSTEGRAVLFTYRARATNGVTGCLRFSGLHVATPDHLRFKVTTSAPNGQVCLAVAPDHNVVIRVTIRPKSESTEIATVTANFEIRGRPSSQWIQETIANRVVIVRPLNLAKAGGLTGLLMLVGVALLLLVLYLMSLYFGRLVPTGEFLSYMIADVAVSSSGQLVDLENGGLDERTIEVLQTSDPQRSSPVRPNRRYISPDGAFVFEVNNQTPWGSLKLLFGKPTASVRSTSGQSLLIGDKDGSFYSSNPGEPITLPSMTVAGYWVFVPEGLSPDRLPRNPNLSRSEEPQPPFISGTLTLVLNARMSDLLPLIGRFLEQASQHFDDVSKIFID